MTDGYTYETYDMARFHIPDGLYSIEEIEEMLIHMKAARRILKAVNPTTQGEEHMTPKFFQLLETCIFDGVVLGHKRAYKHNDAPSEADINQSIVNEVMNEIHDWFDFDELKSIEAPRTWVNLTDEDRVQIKKAADYNQFMTAGEYADKVQKLTEEKLRSKNYG